MSVPRTRVPAHELCNARAHALNDGGLIFTNSGKLCPPLMSARDSAAGDFRRAETQRWILLDCNRISRDSLFGAFDEYERDLDKHARDLDKHSRCMMGIFAGNFSPAGNSLIMIHRSRASRGTLEIYAAELP